MAESFNNWSDLMESKRRASGKEVMIDSSGKRHKVKYRVQSNTKFLIKIINDMNIIKGDRVSDAGISALKNFLNSEANFTSTVGQLSSIFFQRNFIVYQIGRNQATGPAKRSIQKIQFSVQERKDQEGTALYPDVPATLEFVDIDTFGTMSEMSPAVSKGIADAAKTADVEDPVDDVDTEDGTAAIAKGNSETVSERGKKFLYTMILTGKLYLMEFADNGGLIATTRDGSDPNGIISYGQNGIIVWSTTLDDNLSTSSKIAANQNYPLYQDTEITDDTTDKAFFTKIFTDETYRNQIIDKYESEYKNEVITPENLKDLLFYKSGKPIFGGVAADGTVDSTSDSASTSTGEPSTEIEKAAGVDSTATHRRAWQSYLQQIKDGVQKWEAPAATK